MAGISDFTPVTQENIDTIRARMDADVNAGLDPSDPRWVDTTEGGIFHDITQTVGLEMERIWDTLSSEIPAASFPNFAWGEFLDDHAQTYNLVRKDPVAASGTVRFTGDPGTAIPTGTQVGTEPTDPDDDPLVYQTTVSGVIPGGGTIDLDAQALEVGVASNVAVGVVNVLLSSLGGISAVSNVTAMQSGEDQESDPQLQFRILTEIASTEGAGTQDDYTRWALDYPGVGHVTVQPLWAGGGTVRVIVTDSENQPVATDIVDGLQQVLDPLSAPGEGEGLAPVGAVVTVATPALYYVNVTYGLIFESGYSLDGTAGTIPLRGATDDAVAGYVNELGPGSEVVITRVEFEVMSIEGVHDITGTQLAGYLTESNATSQVSADRAYAGTNLPVAAGKVAQLVRSDPSG